MIKINLLPKEIEIMAAARMKMFIITGLIVCIIVGVVSAYFLKLATLAVLDNKIEEVEKELKKLEPIIKKVDAIQNKKKNLNNKMNVINDLAESRLLYPQFMEELAAMLPQKVWLVSLQTKTGNNTLNLTMSVMSRDNYGVADFINVLETNKKFSEPKFTGIVATEHGGESVRSFSIICDYYPTGERPAPEPVKSSNKKRTKKKKR
ncbi:MAG: PilN domain-containing protein [Elusimicrobiota bacterium]